MCGETEDHDGLLEFKTFYNTLFTTQL